VAAGKSLPEADDVVSATGEACCCRLVCGGVAQLVEHLLCKQGVVGSNPVASIFPAVRGWETPPEAHQAGRCRAERDAELRHGAAWWMPLLRRGERFQNRRVTAPGPVGLGVSAGDL
jgi:hypothetical protein